MRRPEVPPEYRLEGPFTGSSTNSGVVWYTISRQSETSFNPLVRIRAYKNNINEAETYSHSKFGPQKIPFPDAESMVKWLETVTALGEL